MTICTSGVEKIGSTAFSRDYRPISSHFSAVLSTIDRCCLGAERGVKVLRMEAHIMARSKASSLSKPPSSSSKTQKARFTSSSGTTLTVQLRQGRRGTFNVSASMKRDGEKKAQSGARSAFMQLDEAQRAFEALIEEAKQRGWRGRMMSIRGMGAFEKIPQAS
jgi:hypothetical protein